MAQIPNKTCIDKCILSFSHNRYPSRKLADQESIEKARREIAAGKQGISHLILRARDDEIDQLKFLFLINGIPIMCYALANLMHSSLQEIVVVGTEEVQRVLDRFLEVVGTHGKTVTFVPEDPDNLSLVNTLRLGRSRLALEPNELVLFQPGDLPFLYDIERILHDEDIVNHNLILWLNSRQKMFPNFQQDPATEFVRRNYHYRYLDEEAGDLHDVKEPNVYPINLCAVEEDIIGQLHGTRKDGKILYAAIKKVMAMPSRFFKLFPILGYHKARFDSDLKRFRRDDSYKFGMHRNNFNRGASTLLGTTFTSKVHDDPAFVSDVDALEDWEDFESLTRYAENKFGEEGLGRIHPGGEALTRFKQQAMPQLKKEIPMYADFSGFLNSLYGTLQMDYVPFDADGKCILPNPNPARVENAFHWYHRKTDRMLAQIEK